ncbi:MAG: hypothetical protein K2X65_06970, partial [Burkholderiaceae bacterium]|nr:hypothetical protein [Burkholderiaceae bacterium]
MTAHALFTSLAACGIVLSVTPDGRGIALPAGLATPDQRAAIVQNKAALIEFLHSIDQAQKPQPAPAITLPPPAPPPC